MSKRKLIILPVIVILIGIASILTTYALDITMTKGTSSNYDMYLTFDISGNVNKELSVEAGKTKTFDIVVNNPYTDTITYGIAYKMLNPTTKPDDLIIAVTNISENTSEGTIDANSKKVISLIIVNDSTSNIQLSLTVVNGYKNGGDLIIPTDYTIISDIYEVGSTSHKSIDNSGANYPDLVDGLIPVVYNSTTSKWVKADTESSTSTYGWYDYTQKKWANAVLVTDTNRSTYQSASAGTTITDSDILAFYVWIPRYKYKVWNINKVIGTDSYNAQTTGIDIVFERGISTTGTISCSYNFNVDTDNGGIDLSTTTAETCIGLNGDYYTHPAFTFGDDEIRGFWMGKFELSSNVPSSSYGGGLSTSLTPRILPNVKPWVKNSIFNYFVVIQNMQKEDNIYGLTTDKTSADSHMIKNMEWGAVAYLTNSNYGRCTDGTCTAVSTNRYGTCYTESTSAKTGCQSTSTTDCNNYNTSLGVTASTTGNVYGVYDMNGGGDDIVAANASSSNDIYTFNSENDGFESGWYDKVSNHKYIDTYAYGKAQDNQEAYNRGRIGDATSEITTATERSVWFGYYIPQFISSSLWHPWLTRGNNFTQPGGIFFFTDGSSIGACSATARATLVLLTN